MKSPLGKFIIGTVQGAAIKERDQKKARYLSAFEFVKEDDVNVFFPQNGDFIFIYKIVKRKEIFVKFH